MEQTHVQSPGSLLGLGSGNRGCCCCPCLPRGCCSPQSSFLHSPSAPFHPVPTFSSPWQVLLEHQPTILPTRRRSTDWHIPSAGGSNSPGSISVLYGTFMTPRASSAHVLPAIRENGSGPAAAQCVRICFAQSQVQTSAFPGSAGNDLCLKP